MGVVDTALTAPTKGVVNVAGGLADTFKISNVLDKISPDPVKKPGVSIVEQYPFIIEEQSKPEAIIRLVGDYLPQKVLPYGGRQRVTKDYYPGNEEPVLHVMGSEETDVSISGRLWDKKFPEPGAALKFATNLDNLRRRGNLLKISWGPWARFAVLGETKFNLKTTKEIEYQLMFTILGFNPPRHCKVTKSKKIPYDTSQELQGLTAEFTSISGVAIPTTILDEINGLISAAASAIAVVTDYVDSTMGTIESTVKAVNRALGLIIVATSAVHRLQTRLRRIAFTDLSNVSVGASEFERPISQSWGGIGTIRITLRQSMVLNFTLHKLRDSLKEIINQLPQARHLVQSGDTLQSLSHKYYGDSSEWNKIKDFNDLEDTTLVPGQIIEIPT